MAPQTTQANNSEISNGVSGENGRLSPSEQRLAGQVAIITGGAGGIGAETARVFTQQGARVVIADIQPNTNANVEKLLKELGPRAEYVQCDVSKEDDVIRVWDRAYSLENRLDIVFNNAGVFGPWGPVDKLRIEDFDATIGVNLRGALLGIKHGARLMKPAGKGSILCTSSVSSVLAGLGPLCYSVSKTAIVGLVKTAALELADHGIRVNALSVAGVATTMVAEIFKKMGGEGAPDLPLDAVQHALTAQSLLPRKTLTANDCANAALFLASDMGGYVNGHNLLVDGGLTTARVVPGMVWS